MIRLVLILFLLLSFQGYGQSPSQQRKTDRLAMYGFTTDSMSVQHQKDIDSVANLLTGRWRLVRVSSGWTRPRDVAGHTIMTVDQQQRVTVRNDGNWVSSFRFVIRKRWREYVFIRDQLKRSPFLGMSAQDIGGLRLYGDTLLLFDRRADSGAYTFKRVLDTVLLPQLSPTACADSMSLVHQCQRVKGVVSFRPDLQAHVMTYTISDSTKQTWVGIFCNWPQAGEYIGRMLTFSGKFYQVTKPKTGLKNETVYYLRLTGLHP